MNKVFFAALVSLGFGVAAQAQAVGCVSGAAAGAVAGHFMHHHAVLGAVGGCIAGHEMAKHDRERQEQQRSENGTYSQQ